MPFNEDGEFRLDGEDKFIERIKKKNWRQLHHIIIRGQLAVQAAKEKLEEGDERAIKAVPRIERQMELVMAEYGRRKALGQSPPPVKVQAKSIPLGSKASMS